MKIRKFTEGSQSREKLTLNVRGNGLLYGDRHEEDGEVYRLVEKEQTYFDSEKTYVEYRIIIKRESDNKFFKGSSEDWGQGQVEIDPNFTEVYPREKIVIVYE